jgi:hypothetical protein
MRTFWVSDSPVSSVTRLLGADLRVFSLFLAIAVYACFGSPTPDSFGLIEFLVGGLIVVAVGFGGFAYVLKGRERQPVWFIIGQVFLLYGFCIGMVGALVSGANAMAIVRDLLPFGFMFLPLFFVLLAKEGRLGFSFVFLFCLLGLVFAVRAGAPYLSLSFSFGYDALYYLGNSPSVLFAVLFLWGVGMTLLAQSLSAFHLLKAVLCFAFSCVALIPIVMTQQRAGMGAFAVYVVLSFLYLFCQSPRRMITISVVYIPLVVWGGLEFVSGAYDLFQEKTALVGANMRAEEWRAVWDAITAHPLSFLFGQGWGASFASPAVADVNVYFTHSLLSSMLLKLGFFGFVVCCGYIGVLLFLLLRHVRSNLLLVMAITAPLLIDVFLYAAFKSLDFGLLLALIPLLGFSDDRQEQPIA